MALAFEPSYMEAFIDTVFAGAEGFVNVRCIDEQARNLFIPVGQAFDVPQNTNVYFGVYARSHKGGRTEACTDTGVLWADYDDMTLSEVRERISGLPEPSIIVSSGHGIHTYWLLQERAGEAAVDVVKAIARATGADSRPAHKAAVMRIPGSVNVKREPVPCRIVEANWRRYDLATFQRLLEVPKRTYAPVAFGGVPELLRCDMPCIRTAACGVPEGHRNFWLGRITKWLQKEGYTFKRAWEIVQEWNRRNRPPEKQQKLQNDFKYYWEGNYKLLGCLQDNPEKQAMLAGYCTGSECELRGTIGRLELDNAIALNNRLFRAYHKLTGNDLIVLGVLNRHPKGLNTSQLIFKLTARATKKPCMSLKTMRESLVTLERRGLISVTQGNRRAGEEDLYRAIPQGTYGTGYTLATNGAVNGAIDGRVTSAEFKLYVLLLKYAFGKGQCFPSLRTLANELRVDEALVSRQLKALDKADYIDRLYGYEGNESKLVFRLLV
jgi:hypothetical protein